MKKILIALAATTAFAGAAPAAAQYGGANIQLRIDQLQTQLQAGVRSGGITRAEAMPLRQRLRQLTDLERQYAPGGLSIQERTDLQNRMASLRQEIRLASRAGDSRYDRDDRDGRWQDRDGRWHDSDDRYSDGRPCPPGLDRKNNGCLPPGQVGRDRDDHDGRWDDERYDRDNDGWDDRNRDGRRDVDSRYDSNRDGWDDRDHDRDGRWDNDDGYSRGQPDNRGVVGQLIDRVTGTGALRVGQRASNNLGAVPYAYRNEFRDGPNSYYRSDGRNIYQINARTQTVTRVYAMNR